jgi:hypothetical protein
MLLVKLSLKISVFNSTSCDFNLQINAKLKDIYSFLGVGVYNCMELNSIKNKQAYFKTLNVKQLTTFVHKKVVIPICLSKFASSI